MMNTAEIFRTLVDTGWYRHGNYMCFVLDSAQLFRYGSFGSVIRTLQSSPDEVSSVMSQASEDIKEFLEALVPQSEAIDPGAYRALKCTIAQLCLPSEVIKNEDSSVRDEHFEDFLEVYADILKDACVDIYSSWDDRFEIVEQFVNRFKVKHHEA